MKTNYPANNARRNCAVCPKESQAWKVGPSPARRIGSRSPRLTAFTRLQNFADFFARFRLPTLRIRRLSPRAIGAQCPCLLVSDPDTGASRRPPATTRRWPTNLLTGRAARSGLIATSAVIDSGGYAIEELVAELGVAFPCADLERALEPRKDHASYVQLERLA